MLFSCVTSKDCPQDLKDKLCELKEEAQVNFVPQRKVHCKAKSGTIRQILFYPSAFLNQTEGYRMLNVVFCIQVRKATSRRTMVVGGGSQRMWTSCCTFWRVSQLEQITAWWQATQEWESTLKMDPIRISLMSGIFLPRSWINWTIVWEGLNLRSFCVN